MSASPGTEDENGREFVARCGLEQCYTLVLHLLGMASKHPRLGVPRDPDLDRALSETRPLLASEETRSGAAQIRALALRGARAVLADAGPEAVARARLREKYNLIPATSDLSSLGPPEGEVDPDDPTPASDALRWVRGE